MSKIRSSKFKGHQGSVLCLDFNSSDSLLLSGSEDQTARIWDVRDASSRRRASLCIVTQGEVLSACFVPPIAGNATGPGSFCNPDETASNRNCFAQDHSIFLAVEKTVLEYDLRQASTPIITEPAKDWTPVLQNKDDVNQIALTYHPSQTNSKNSRSNKRSSKGKSSSKRQQRSSLSDHTQTSLYVASADDAGMVRFFETPPSGHPGSAAIQVLAHDPEGLAVVPTCAFRTGGGIYHRKGKKNTLELVSGGTDCKLHLWDLSRPKRPISSVTIQTSTAESANENSKPQVCNPPMVHTLSWDFSGEILAAGLGSGDIPIFSLENRQLVQTGFLTDGHSNSVATVTWARFEVDNGLHHEIEPLRGRSTQRILCSGGSDGMIYCWDATVFNDCLWLLDEEEDQAGNKEKIKQLVGSAQEQQKNAGYAGAIFPDHLLILEEKMKQNLSLQNSNKSKIIFGIPHGNKLNWITTTGRRQSGAALFAADTSNDISSYDIPLI